jgi:hypothetical protein
MQWFSDIFATNQFKKSMINNINIGNFSTADIDISIYQYVNINRQESNNDVIIFSDATFLETVLNLI